MHVNAQPQPSLLHFLTINTKTFIQNLSALIQEERQQLEQHLTTHTQPWQFDDLIPFLEASNDKLHHLWSPFAHLNAVAETDERREVYREALPILTEYHTWLSHHIGLYQAMVAIKESSTFTSLTAPQQKIIENALRDFRLSGVHLDAEKKAEALALTQTLSTACNRFQENILDATGAWFYHTETFEPVDGLPEEALKLAQENAKQRNVKGYVITLDHASYSSAMKFIHNRELRKTLYEAYVTRASEVGPNGGQFDNASVMATILDTRLKLAHLLGFPSYADFALANRMAHSFAQVITFLNELIEKALPVAQQEINDLKKFAQQKNLNGELEAYDLAYYSEHLQKSLFSFNNEELRPYFPIDHVMTGLFELVEQLYGIRFEKITAEVWHRDVEVFQIKNEQQETIGYIYQDLYARPKKRDGAWMDDGRQRRRLASGKMQLPIAFLTCNFMPPAPEQPGLLTHDDVVTLFHEFGHCLHHLLTEMEYSSISGINGVPWDAVELPSQFMENFCYQHNVLAKLAEHYQTKQPLPENLFHNLIAAKQFQTGMQFIRQLEFALFDFLLHQHDDLTTPHQIEHTLAEVRARTALLPIPAFNRFQNSFSHIFAGGYAAGYYSYKWAELLSADVYSRFEENPRHQAEVGRAFLQHILSQGGAVDPMKAFVAFRGREPKIDALLRLNGIPE